MASGKNFNEFGHFRLDLDQRVLSRAGRPVSLTPKALDILLVLMRNAGQIVEKEALMKEVWTETYVDESNLTQNIFTLRRVLGESSGEPRYIETVPRRGYRFAAEMKIVRDGIEAMAGGGQAPAAATRESRADGAGEEAGTSLAVLPFVNASEDPNAEYLSDGIAETIINSLSQLSQLRVMSRSAVFRYKGKEADVQAIGQQLGVRAILVGRLLSVDNKLIISAELVDVANGWQLWGEKYNRQFSDIFEVQDEIARNISESLRIRLTGEDEKRLVKHYTENSEAYQLYLKGRYYWAKYSRDGLDKSIECFREAIDLDPTYALAYAGTADAYFRLATNYVPPREALPKAKAAAAIALEIDDMLPEAHASLGMAKMRYDLDWEGAEIALKRAIELKPKYATAHQWYGVYLYSTGRFDEALAEMSLALELDPLSLQLHVTLGTTLWKMRDYDRALQKVQEALVMDPNYQSAYLALGVVLEQKGELSQAIIEFERANQLGETSMALGFLGRVYAVSGKSNEARAVIDELKKQATVHYVSSYSIALIYAGLGENDQAFQLLEKAYDDRDEFLTWLRTDPRLDSLRSDPRLSEMMRRIGLSP